MRGQAECGYGGSAEQRPAKRLPAYGRQLLEIRLRGEVPAHYMAVVALDDWKLGALFPRIVIARDIDPVLAELSMLAGLDVTIAWCPTKTAIERRDTAIREVLKVNPTSLRAFDLDNVDVLWVKSNARGIERPEYLQ